METIYNLQRRADTLRKKTQTGSISPEEVGGLHADTLAYIADMEQSADCLGIRKIYKTKTAMEADTEPVGTNGKVLRFGQLVSVYDADNKTSPENGNIYAWQKPGWRLMGNIGDIYELTQRIDQEVEARKAVDTDLLKRIQGTSVNSNPYEDPFKLVRITSETLTPLEAFNTWLDNLHPVDGQSTAEKQLSVGFFRVIMGGLQYEVHNLITAWGANRCRQVLHGIVSVSESGKIQGGARYNILQRDYDGQKWSEWEPVGGTLRTASINGKPLPVSGSNVNLNTGKGLQVESGDTLTLKLGTGMRYGPDGELISDVTASDKEELQNANNTITKSITQLKQDVKTQKDDLLHRIQGTAEDSKPYEDPFKLVQINSEAGTPMEAFNAWLDNLHPVDGQTYDEKKTTVGFFRVIAGGLQYEVHNFIASWGKNICNQVLLGIVNKDANGAITWGARYNILQRSYNGTEWSEWTSVIGGNMNMQLGTGLKLGTDGKIYVDISAIMNI